jgi:hypothetical protein
MCQPGTAEDHAKSASASQNRGYGDTFAHDAELGEKQKAGKRLTQIPEITPFPRQQNRLKSRQ